MKELKEMTRDELERALALMYAENCQLHENLAIMEDMMKNMVAFDVRRITHVAISDKLH